MRFAFVIEGAPVSWKRTATHAGRQITPARQRAYQERVKWAALAARPKGWPLGERYSIHVVVHRDRRRADWDNSVKTVCDALTGIAWTDDAQVDAGAVVMRRGSTPYRVEVTITVMEGCDD